MGSGAPGPVLSQRRARAKNVHFDFAFRHVQHQLLPLLRFIFFLGIAGPWTHNFDNSIKKLVVGLTLAKFIDGKVASDPIKPESRFTGWQCAPRFAVKLQKTFLRQVLSERYATAKQAFKKPAEAGVEILKQRGELLVFTRHSVRYTN